MRDAMPARRPTTATTTSAPERRQRQRRRRRRSIITATTAMMRPLLLILLPVVVWHGGQIVVGNAVVVVADSSSSSSASLSLPTARRRRRNWIWSARRQRTKTFDALDVVDAIPRCGGADDDQGDGDAAIKRPDDDGRGEDDSSSSRQANGAQGGGKGKNERGNKEKDGGDDDNSGDQTRDQREQPRASSAASSSAASGRERPPPGMAAAAAAARRKKRGPVAAFLSAFRVASDGNDDGDAAASTSSSAGAGAGRQRGRRQLPHGPDGRGGGGGGGVGVNVMGGASDDDNDVVDDEDDPELDAGGGDDGAAERENAAASSSVVIEMNAPSSSSSTGTNEATGTVDDGVDAPRAKPATGANTDGRGRIDDAPVDEKGNGGKAGDDDDADDVVTAPSSDGEGTEENQWTTSTFANNGGGGSDEGGGGGGGITDALPSTNGRGHGGGRGRGDGDNASFASTSKAKAAKAASMLRGRVEDMIKLRFEYDWDDGEGDETEVDFDNDDDDEEEEEEEVVLADNRDDDSDDDDAGNKKIKKEGRYDEDTQSDAKRRAAPRRGKEVAEVRQIFDATEKRSGETHGVRAIAETAEPRHHSHHHKKRRRHHRRGNVNGHDRPKEGEGESEGADAETGTNEGGGAAVEKRRHKIKKPPSSPPTAGTEEKGFAKSKKKGSAAALDERSAYDAISAPVVSSIGEDEVTSEGPKKQQHRVTTTTKERSKTPAVAAAVVQGRGEDGGETTRGSVGIVETAAEDATSTGSPYVSSGYWHAIDFVASLGLSSVNPSLKVSKPLRSVRKATARATGLHGLLSGKGRPPSFVGRTTTTTSSKDEAAAGSAIVPLDDDDERSAMRRRRLAAIEAAKGRIARGAADGDMDGVGRNEALSAGAVASEVRGLRRWRRAVIGAVVRRNRRGRQPGPAEAAVGADGENAASSNIEETRTLEENEEEVAARRNAAAEEHRRSERVEEIDRLIQSKNAELLELQCEKDDLQQRPNPLFNYTAKSQSSADDALTAPRTSRKFNFPPDEVVDEYIVELINSGRLVMLNHTLLWQSGSDMDESDDEDEAIGDDLLTPSADARKLYESVDDLEPRPRKVGGKNNGEDRRNGSNGGGGSWLLRQTLGMGGSLGEKIGEATENAAYKAVCSAVMSILARSISAIHGVNVMSHSDIRLFVEKAPDLPPVGRRLLPGGGDGDNYAQEAIQKAIRKGAKRHGRRRSTRSHSLHHGHDLSEEVFLQRDAVVETLISHCQISAPLLKLFPLAWQRAILGNIITLVAAVVSDFADGIKIQILGHQLSFSYKPVTESDMIQHIGMGGGLRFNHRRARPEEFEAAVRATAQDISASLTFLDRWHERALGSKLLRAQIGNLIARIVLTLVDEVLSGAQMDLWSVQAGGPRIVAALEYRTSLE